MQERWCSTRIDINTLWQLTVCIFLGVPLAKRSKLSQCCNSECSLTLPANAKCHCSCGCDGRMHRSCAMPGVNSTPFCPTCHRKCLPDVQRIYTVFFLSVYSVCMCRFSDPLAYPGAPPPPPPPSKILGSLTEEKTEAKISNYGIREISVLAWC